MSDSGKPKNSADSGKGRAPYGTQQADFGQVIAAQGSGSGRGAQGSGSGSFGTMVPKPVNELADALESQAKGLPAQEAYREVARTHRADGSQLSALTRLAEVRKNQDVSRTMVTPASGAQRSAGSRPPGSPPDGRFQKTTVNPPRGTTQPVPMTGGRTMQVPSSRPPQPDLPTKRSTWDLRIHQRQVSGHLSGIVNPVPAGAENLTGLQSAFAIDPSAPEYEILGQLGAGAMGIVYRARQLSLNRELAIKTLKPDTVNAEHDQAMFVSEAVVTANLVHPNIVPIHDLGRTDDGKLFYSMKCVTGVPWNDVIRQKSLEENLDIFMKLCDAVAYAHSRGVINRDLKPENVVVGDYGEVVVLDWGLAITTHQFEKRNSVVQNFRGGAGTPVYMAPELLDEDISSIGTFSDIYLLGAILYEMLEGFPPHLLRKLWDVADPQEQLDGVIWAVINNDVEDDTMHRGELMQIALRAMATEPMDRYGSVSEIQEAIREYRITGRAEELLNSVDVKKATSYTEFQSAVALYSEALRKWPRNRRAVEGDRRARLAYAHLAHRKGDFDLGLQVIAGQTDDEFRPLISRLRKSRFVRTLIRATWMLTTVSAVALLLWGMVLFQRNIEEKNRAVAAEQEIRTLSGDVDKLTAAADEQVRLATTAKEEADLANARAEEKNAELAVRGKELEAATVRISDAEKQLTELKNSTQKLQEDADKAIVDAMKARTEAMKATELLDSARNDASKAVAEANRARELQFEYERDGFNSRLDAADKLGDYTQLIQIANEAIKQGETNPLIHRQLDTLDKRIREAIRNGGNAAIPLPGKPEVGAISDDGTTVVSVNRDGVVTVLRSPAGFPEEPVASQQIQTDLKSGLRCCVSADGRNVFVSSRTSRKLWQLSDGSYQEVPPENSGAVDAGPGWCFFSPNGKHLYVVASDEMATVEILDAESGKLLVRQALAGGATKRFRVKDVVLVPDESALIVQYSLIECYEYRITWSGGTPSFGTRLANTAPRLNSFAVDDEKLLSGKPDRLFVSPDGSLLALAFAESVVILPRRSQSSTETFSYGLPSENDKASVFRCSFAVRDLVISRDNQRIVTGHGNRYLELWDRQGDTYVPCDAKGLFEHRPTRSRLNSGYAACLRGHSDVGSAAVKSVSFRNGDADRLVSVSSDQTLRTWQVSTYSDLVTGMKKVREVLNTRPAAASRRNRQRNPRAGEYLLTGLPGGSSQQTPRPRRFRQGQGIFSARFSPDSRRLLIGADDLAAHVFDSQTGRRVLSASMSGRKDLFFDPDRNNFLEGHISEISSVQFMPPLGELLLSADYFGSISVWDASPDDNGIGFEKSRLLSEYSFSEFAVSQDGTLVLAGGATTSNPEGPLQNADLKHMGVVWRTADILQSPGPVPYLTLEGQHPDFAITAVGISPSSGLLVTAGRRGRMVIWNASDGSVVASVPESHNSDQVSGVFFESETSLVSAGYDGKVYRWTLSGDSLTAAEIRRPEGQSDPEFIVRLRPSPDRTRFATSEVSVIRSEGGKKSGQLNIQIWTDSQATPLQRPVIVPETDKELAFRHDISWSGDGRHLLFVQDGQMTVFETEKWMPLRRFQLTEPDARPVRGAIAPSTDGAPLMAATFDGRFTHLWDLTDGRHVAEFRSHAMYSVIASFSPDQKYVATASETLRIFDGDEDSPNHGSTIYRQPIRAPHDAPLADVKFHPMEGGRLATIDTDGTLEFWDWDPQAERPLVPHGQPIRSETVTPEWSEDLRFGNSILWGPEGQSAVVIQKGEASLLRIQENEVARTAFPLPEGLDARFNQLDLSADGHRVTAGGVAWNTDASELVSFAAVWEISGESPGLIGTITGEHSTSVLSRSERTGITGRRSGIMAIAFDDRAAEIITGGADGRLIRWNLTGLDGAEVVAVDRIADMREEGTENAHRASLTAIDVSSDGRIVTTDQLGEFILWPSNAE